MSILRRAAGTTVCALVLATGACSLLPDAKPDPDETFNHALAVCKLHHAGGTSRRANLPKTDVHLVSCLKARGWTPDGNRTAQPAEPQ